MANETADSDVDQENVSDAKDEVIISDSDRDSLHTLPLGALPLKSTALKSARLIKNARLESMVELFRNQGIGSLQLPIAGLSGNFGWPESPAHPDVVLLRELEPLTSYDVFSLRITLREAGIPIQDIKALQLSEEKTKQLTSYMSAFTRPLIEQIYGASDVGIESFEDVLNLFRNPDVRKAREQLKVMADKLGIELTDIPRFLEDYGDIFLSLSYFKSCLAQIEPVNDEFLQSLGDLRKNHQLKSDFALMESCATIETTIVRLISALHKLFDNFKASTENFWSDMTEKNFKEVEEMIRGQHITIGGILCGLTVKLDSYKENFPTPDTGGPVKRAEFIRQDMKQGIEQIRKAGFRKPTPKPAYGGS
jgi:hypothetical protein